MSNFKALLFSLSVLAFMAAPAITEVHAAKKAHVAAPEDDQAAAEKSGDADSATPKDQSAKDDNAKSGAASSSAAMSVSEFKEITERGWVSDEKNIPLTKLSGEWQFKMAFWAVPGAEPKWTRGVFRNKMTLDGRFLSSTFDSDLDIGGNDAKITGQGLIGYDNAKKSYTSVWADNLNPSLMTGAGKYDAKSKAIIETGEFTNPLTGKEAEFRSELKFTGDDDYTRTIFVVGKSGKDTKLMEFDCSKGGTIDGPKQSKPKKFTGPDDKTPQ